MTQAFVAPKPETKLIIGTVPCFNMVYLNTVMPIVSPGLAEMVAGSMEETNEWKVFNRIYLGSLHLTMAYMDLHGAASNDSFQEAFTSKLRKPEEDFIWWVITELQEMSLHIYAAYVKPEYRSYEVMARGMKYLEDYAREKKCPYLSLASRKDEAFKRMGFTELSSYYRKKL